MSYITIIKMNLITNLRRTFLIRQSCFSSLVNTGSKGITKAEEKKIDEELFLKIKTVESHKDLFNIISNQGKNFTQKHVMGTLKILLEISKSNSDYVKNGNIIVHPAFETFCLILKKQSRTFFTNDIIEALKTLSVLGVKGNSVIFQYLLQLLRQMINHLNLQEAMFLDYLLSKCEKTPLSDSLQLALPLIFQLKFPSQIDRYDVSKLTEMMLYASEKQLPENYINSIMTCLLLDYKNIDYKMAISIFFSLNRLNQDWETTSKPYKKLYTHCSDILASNINQLSYQQLIRISNFLRIGILDYNVPYIEKLANAITQYPVENNLDFKDCIQIARQLNRIHHSHIELINYMTDLLIEDGDLLSEEVVVFTFIYTNSLVWCDYKPKSWNSISQLICKSYIKSLNRFDYPWIRFAIDLASLGIYDDPLLKLIFEKDFLENNMRVENVLDSYQLIQIYTAVQTFYTSYTGPLPTQSLIESCKKMIKSKEVDPLMKGMLEVTFGPECVANSIQLPDGFYVDFVINFENEQATAFPKLPMERIVNFNDLNIKDKNNAILIMHFHNGCYSVNVNRLNSSYKLILDIMEEKGYNVLPISLKDWHNLKDAEKIPYILREINLITSIDKRYL